MIYTNGIKLNIADIVRLTFVDSNEAEVRTVAEVSMQYESLKRFHEGIGRAIDDHEAKAAQLQENARKAH